MSKLLYRASFAYLVVFALFGGPIGIAVAPTAQAQVTEPATPQVATSTPPIPKAEDALACNCWQYTKSLIPSLPNTTNLKPNTTPKVGAVAIFSYGGLPHYGVIVSLTADGFELQDSNYRHCKYMTHFVSWSNTSIKGFWAP